MTNLEVAQTILNQLGGTGRLTLMAGCKNYATGYGPQDLSVSFSVGRNEKSVTKCRIQLDPSDTYTVQFYQGRGVHMRKVSESSDIYAESLMDLFEAQTGLYLTLNARK